MFISAGRESLKGGLTTLEALFFARLQPPKESPRIGCTSLRSAGAAPFSGDHAVLTGLRGRSCSGEAVLTGLRGRSCGGGLLPKLKRASSASSSHQSCDWWLLQV